MKKITLSIILIAISISSTKAQGLYFGVGGGYGFSAAKSTYQNQSSSIDSSYQTSQITVKPYSLGKGLNLGLYMGYMFNKHIGAEIGAAYVIGYKFKMTLSRNGANNVYDNQDETFQGSMIRIVPTVKYVLGENKIHPYMKAGLIIGVGAKVITDFTYSDSPPNSVGESIIEYKGGVSFGFHGALGVNYMFTDRIGIFAELAANYQNYAPKKSELTKDTQNGVDILPSLYTSETQTNYVSSYSTLNNNNNSQPLQESKFYMPFSSIGFNIGLHISLEKKTTENK